MCQKFDFRKEPKAKQHFFTHACRSLICICFIAEAFQSEDGKRLDGVPLRPIFALL